MCCRRVKFRQYVSARHYRTRKKSSASTRGWMRLFGLFIDTSQSAPILPTLAPPPLISSQSCHAIITDPPSSTNQCQALVVLITSCVVDLTIMTRHHIIVFFSQAYPTLCTPIVSMSDKQLSYCSTNSTLFTLPIACQREYVEC